MKTPIPIALAFNNGYTKQATITMLSALEHKEAATHYHFYLLIYKLLPSNKTFISQTLESYSHDFALSFIELDDHQYQQIPLVGVYGKETNFRLFLPILLPNEPKLIYLDCDMLVKRDLTELFKTNLNQKAYAAVSEKNHYRYTLSPYFHAEVAKRFNFYKNYLNIDLFDEKNHYINAGLLVINNHYWQEHHYLKRSFAFLEKYGPLVGYPDQDALNVLALEDGPHSRVFLSSSWNFVTYLLFRNIDLHNEKEVLTETVLRSFNLSRAEALNPAIIHFATSAPWKGYRCLFTDQYLHYAEKIGWHIPFKKRYYKRALKAKIAQFFPKNNPVFKLGSYLLIAFGAVLGFLLVLLGYILKLVFGLS